MWNRSFVNSDASEDANDYSWHIEFRRLSPRWYVHWDFDSLWESLKDAFGKWDGDSLKQQIEGKWEALIDASQSQKADSVGCKIWEYNNKEWTSRDIRGGIVYELTTMLPQKPKAVSLPVFVRGTDVLLFFEFSCQKSFRNNSGQKSFDCHFSIRDYEGKPLQPMTRGLLSLRDTSGNKLQYKPSDLSLFLPALLNIATSPPNASYVEIETLNSRLEIEFNGLLSSDRMSSVIVLNSGLILRKNLYVLTDFDFNGGEKVWIRLQKDNQTSDYAIDLLIGDDDTRVALDKCVPKIYQQIERASCQNALPDLRSKADSENWDSISSNGEVQDNHRLEYYLIAIFDRLTYETEQTEKERLPNASGYTGDSVKKSIATRTQEYRNRPFVRITSNGCDTDELFFNTGLVTPLGHYIYAHCLDKDQNAGRFQKIEWLSHEGTPKRRTLNPTLKKLAVSGAFHHGLPFPPNWIDEPERLLFDYRFGSIEDGDIGFSYNHIHMNLQTRLPGELQGQFNRDYPFYRDMPLTYSDNFKRYLHAAWRRTRKYLQQNFKNAIPTYYRGKIQLLVPLFLDESDENKASAALVLAINEDESKHAPGKSQPYYYWCPTALSLDMARMNSRVITRIDATWLSEPSGSQG